MKRDRIVIVGGGLLGCAVALELARRGAEVTVLERVVVGAEASTAAAGILAPRLEAHGKEPMRSLGIASLEMYGDWIERMEADVGLRRTGLLRVVLPGGPADSPDVDAQWLDATAALAAEPGLPRDVVGAWLLPDEATLDPRKLVPALHRAAVLAGVDFVMGGAVRQVDGEHAELEDGRSFLGRVVVCAGAWTARIPGLERLPVRPVRGQLAGLAGVPIRHVLFGAGGYLVPRADGRVVAGATVEEVGYERGVTAGGVRQVLAAATAMIPGLGSAQFEGAWSGFRPGTPDDLPILGQVGGVWVASGHYRNGVLLAPITGQWIADAMLEGKALPAAFAPGRFGS